MAILSEAYILIALVVLAILVIMLVPLAVMIVFRILNEEEVLLRELPGYREYYGKVRYRLGPCVWGTSRYPNLPIAITPAASHQL
jgi:protein-S-isoprenylcysteine O-methyltransferase Ste14